ncbi:MAG: hypothetical protein ACT4O1_16540 [Gemmatimonadota bacterium]
MLKYTIAIGVALSVAACTSRSETTAPDALEQSVIALRELTRPYQNLEQARSAGYDTKITDCMSDAQGGMGYHFGKGSYIDGTVEEMKPEIVMYEPAPNGELKLVGIEYVVPFDKWTSPNPPQLFGHSFARNEMFKVWALHMWIWRDNPAGLFTGWNPTVSCAHSASAKL